MLDATKPEEQRKLLEIELDTVGIRLNKQKPDVVFKKRTTGGLAYFAKCVLYRFTDLRWSRQNHGWLSLFFSSEISC